MTLTTAPIRTLQAAIETLGQVSMRHATNQRIHDRNCTALVVIERAITCRSWRAINAGIVTLRRAADDLQDPHSRLIERAMARSRWLALLDAALAACDECETLDEMDGVVPLPTRPRLVWSAPR